ncbi:Contactin-3 [Homalodisca vitripennis]|nr:Contactin-3 [Homalodisca vitripennis]
MWRLLLIAPLICLSSTQEEASWRCPQYWIQFQSSCYRFIKSPLHTRNDARKNCQAYESDLVSVNSVEEHGFLLYNLLWQDPQHRRWYTGSHQQSPGYWVNEDGTPLPDMESAFLPEPAEPQPNKDYMVYSLSQIRRRTLNLTSKCDSLQYLCLFNAIHNPGFPHKNDKLYLALYPERTTLMARYSYLVWLREHCHTLLCETKLKQLKLILNSSVSVILLEGVLIRGSRDSPLVVEVTDKKSKRFQLKT